MVKELGRKYRDFLRVSTKEKRKVAWVELIIICKINNIGERSEYEKVNCIEPCFSGESNFGTQNLERSFSG